MTTTIARPTRQASRAGWLVPVGLILLTLIPIVAAGIAAARLRQTATPAPAANPSVEP